jgi:hypothetical protein
VEKESIKGEELEEKVEVKKLKRERNKKEAKRRGSRVNKGRGCGVKANQKKKMEKDG